MSMKLRYLLFTALFCGILSAQMSVTGTISGTVVDPSGQAVAKAAIQLHFQRMRFRLADRQGWGRDPNSRHAPVSRISQLESTVDRIAQTLSFGSMSNEMTTRASSLAARLYSPVLAPRSQTVLARESRRLDQGFQFFG